MTMEALAQFAPWLVGGVALGAVYMHLIARSVAVIGPSAPARGAIALFILRFALAASVLTLAAMQGAGPLLAVLAGFLLARTVAIRRAKKG